jgi:hypothetical protein
MKIAVAVFLSTPGGRSGLWVAGVYGENPEPLPSAIRGPTMNQEHVRIVLTFSPDDQAWIRRGQIVVPRFWDGHSIAPLQGDAIRVGGRQFLIQARVWEHDGERPVLRLFVGGAHAQSDTVFG